MTDGELKDYITKLNTKIDRLKPSDDRIIEAYESMKKRRKQLVTSGCSVSTLKEVDYMISLIEQIANSLKKVKERMAAVEAEQKRREVAEREKKYLEEQIKRQSNPFNMKCNNFRIFDGEPECDVKMDMTFCSTNCPYATNNRGHYEVDGKGRVISKTHYYRMENGKWSKRS